MDYLSKIILCTAALSSALWVPSGIAGIADRPQRVVVKCFDAADDKPLECKFSLISASPQEKEGTAVTFDLLEPIITLEIAAPGYRSREIEINAASRTSTAPRITVYLAKEFPKGQVFTLRMVNRAKESVDNGEIDKAIVLFEQIAYSKHEWEEGSTFQTRFLYWRMSALFKGCTTLFYYEPCETAKLAIKDLRIKIEERPEDFEREHVSSRQLDGYPLDLDIASFRMTIAMANWFNARGDFTNANEQYIAARAVYIQATDTFRKEAKVSLEGLNKDIAAVQEKLARASAAAEKQG